MSSVLVDTSVWRRYFAGTVGARTSGVLSDLLDLDDGVLCHRAVVGELVLGGLSSREEALLARLPTAPEVTNTEVLAFVRSRRLSRRGVGWVDSHLLASALVGEAKLWSLDRKLADAAAALGAGFDETTDH